MHYACSDMLLRRHVTPRAIQALAKALKFSSEALKTARSEKLCLTLGIFQLEVAQEATPLQNS